MIPPPRHLSDNLASRSAVLPVPAPANWRNSADQIPVGSYNPSETLLATSPMASPSSRIEDEELEMSEDSSNSVWYRRSGSGKIASSFPGVGIHMAVKSLENSQALPLQTLEINKPAGVAGNVALLCWMEFNLYSFPLFLFSFDAGGVFYLFSLC